MSATEPHDTPAAPELTAAAWEALERAHAPYSRFRVGAALETQEGEIVVGCNVENVALNLGLCAERVALFAALSRGDHPGRRLVVVSDAAAPISPCGACRQVLREFAPHLEVVSVGRGGAARRWAPGALLPRLPRRPGRSPAVVPAELIARKRDGAELQGAEIEALVAGLVNGDLEQHQMSAFMMAVFLRGMSLEEIVHLTRAMASSGAQLDLRGIAAPRIDKHSTGGVGDKVSLPLVPLAMAAGLRVPMISGRGLGHTGGTLDKLESIPGYRTALSIRELEARIADPGAFVAGQTAELVPADRMMYALRDVSATVASVPLIVSSILSKKISAGLTGLVLDVKYGRGAFMPDREQALQLAQTLVEVAGRLELPTVALLTRMEMPIGRTVGNALEVRESFDLLRGEPADPELRELTLALGGLMRVVAGQATTLAQGAARLEELLESGAALAAARRWVAAQGGDARVVDEPERLVVAGSRDVIRAPRAGYVHDIDALEAGLLGVQLGGGRRLVSDPIDPGVGLTFHCRRGSRVAAGEPLVTLYLPAAGIDSALRVRAERLVTLGEASPPTRSRVDCLVTPAGLTTDPWGFPREDYGLPVPPPDAASAGAPRAG